MHRKDRGTCASCFLIEYVYTELPCFVFEGSCVEREHVVQSRIHDRARQDLTALDLGRLRPYTQTGNYKYA